MDSSSYWKLPENEIENSRHIFSKQTSKDLISRNEEQVLSQNDSSLWNFKSIDVTHNSSWSVLIDEMNNSESKGEIDYPM